MSRAMDDFRASLLEVSENLSPIFEFAEGQRAAMEQRGWSPTAAETAALDILRGLLALALQVKS